MSTVSNVSKGVKCSECGEYVPKGNVVNMGDHCIVQCQTCGKTFVIRNRLIENLL